MKQQTGRRATQIGLAVVAIVASEPVEAAEAPDWIKAPRADLPAEARETKDPATAVLWSALGPVALVCGAFAVSFILQTALAPAGGGSDFNSITLGAAAFSPLLLGSGQVYAGDPLRGALVGGGWYAATLGGFGLGFAAGRAQGGQFNDITLGTLGAIVAGSVYAGWALFDAHATAEASSAPATGRQD